MPKPSTVWRNYVLQGLGQFKILLLFSGEMPSADTPPLPNYGYLPLPDNLLVLWNTTEALNWTVTSGAVTAALNTVPQESGIVRATGTVGYAALVSADYVVVDGTDSWEVAHIWSYLTVGLADAEVVLSSLDLIEGTRVTMLSGSVTVSGN